MSHIQQVPREQYNLRLQCGMETHRATFKSNSQRPPRPVPPDQNQCDWEEIRADNLDSGLVRAGRPETLPPASTRLRYSVVPERASESVHSDRCTRRRGGIPGHSHHWREGCEVCGREISREVRGERREEVLFEIRCGRFGGTRL